MDISKDSIHIADTIGSVSCEIMAPASMNSFLVLAHGAGAGMQHPFMVKLSQALAEEGVGTMRYNFPYMEQKKKRPDVAPVAEKTVSCAIDFATKRFPNVPVFAGGKSFGGRMTSQWLSKAASSTVKGIIFYGFPLHPAGKPAVERAAHLHQLQLPMLFLQGTKDALAELHLLEPVCNALSLATLTKFEGADHAFHVSKKDIIPLLAEASVHWIRTIVK